MRTSNILFCTFNVEIEKYQEVLVEDADSFLKIDYKTDPLNLLSDSISKHTKENVVVRGRVDEHNTAQ